MTDDNWIEVCDVSEIVDGEPRESVVSDRIVALFKVDENIYAMDGICPHHGGPLGQGTLDGCIVSCPWHGWRFDVTDGAYQSSEQMAQQTFPVKVENGKVLVNVAS